MRLICGSCVLLSSFPWYPPPNALFGVLCFSLAPIVVNLQCIVPLSIALCGATSDYSRLLRIFLSRARCFCLQIHSGRARTSCSITSEWIASRQCGSFATANGSYCSFGPLADRCSSPTIWWWVFWGSRILVRLSDRQVSSDCRRRLLHPSNLVTERVACLPKPMVKSAMDQPDTTTHRFAQFDQQFWGDVW